MVKLLPSLDELKIYGERLAVVDLGDDVLKTEGSIITPDTAFRVHYFVRVVAKGDGVFKNTTGTTTRVMPDVTVGDLVLVQVNPHLAAGAHYNVGGEQVLIIHWGEAIAKIVDQTQPVSSHNIVPLGRWVFTDIKIATQVEGLYLPDASSVGEVSWRLVAAGPQSGIELPIGSRVDLERSRANVFSLGDSDDPDGELVVRRPRNLVYVDPNDVLGAIVDLS